MLVLARYVYVLEEPEDKRSPFKPALAGRFQWLPDVIVRPVEPLHNGCATQPSFASFCCKCCSAR